MVVEHQSLKLPEAESSLPEKSIAKLSKFPGEQDSSVNISMSKFLGNLQSSNKLLEEPIQDANESSDEANNTLDLPYSDISRKLLKIIDDSSDEKNRIVEICKQIASTSEELKVDNTELRKINEEWKTIHAKRDFLSKFQGKVIRTQELQLQAQRVNFKAVKDLLEVRRKNGTNAIDPDVKQALERVVDAGVILSSTFSVPKSSVQTHKTKEKDRFPGLETKVTDLTHQYPEKHDTGTAYVGEDKPHISKPATALSDEELLNLSKRLPETKLKDVLSNLLAYMELSDLITAALQIENEELLSRPAQLEAEIMEQHARMEKLSKEKKRLNNDYHKVRQSSCIFSLHVY
jgi:predicted nuclease with TOPRIM domain